MIFGSRCAGKPGCLSQMPADDAEIILNPSGKFVQGGPDADTGLTGRKLMVDSYGTFAPHGGGAFSGKDATKVDRSGAYMARYIAKNMVAAHLANRCQVTLAYAIGEKDPVMVDVNTFGTGICEDDCLAAAVRKVYSKQIPINHRHGHRQYRQMSPTEHYAALKPVPCSAFSFSKYLIGLLVFGNQALGDFENVLVFSLLLVLDLAELH